MTAELIAEGGNLAKRLRKIDDEPGAALVEHLLIIVGQLGDRHGVKEIIVERDQLRAQRDRIQAELILAQEALKQARGEVKALEGLS